MPTVLDPDSSLSWEAAVMKGLDFLWRSFVIIFATLFFGDLPGNLYTFLLYPTGDDSLLESKPRKNN